MLNKEAKANIKLIKKTAKQVFGSNVKFGKIEILKSPYPEFEWTLQVYDQVDVFLAYDRSALDIGVPKDGKPVLVSEYTDKPFVRGMAASKPENLLNDFLLLDEVVREHFLK